MIRTGGKGRFSHWGDGLWFSASDGGDPRVNGRAYTVRGRFVLPPTTSLWLLAAVLAGGGLAAGRMGGRAVPWAAALRRLTGGGASRSWSSALVPLILVAAGGPQVMRGEGVMVWAALTLVLFAGICGLVVVVHLLLPRRFSNPYPVMVNAALSGLVIGGMLMTAEAAVIFAPAPPVYQPVISPGGARPRLLDPAALDRIKQRGQPQVMPKEWAERAVAVPGATRAYDWQGALHVYDADSRRRASPIPPKRPGVFRILVFGDSLTYGMGVEERFTYVAVLERELRKHFTVEVLNLGINGWQSEDILAAMKRDVASLEADQVIYGICQNDFLPSGTGQYTHQGDYAVPLPRNIKAFFVDRTRLGEFLDQRYDLTLRRFHLRYDFFDDILANFGGTQIRFRHDVAEMNKLVTGLGLPPVMAMVVDQFPEAGGRGQSITHTAEAAAREAGMTVIPTESYYRTYSGRAFSVSQWEGHPNEMAHAIFAEMLYDALAAGKSLPPTGQ
ncbi:MAG: hypothetical protein HY055_05840 [Magnetospirillum sp.]|nr:hypothetical protein [Magnetospirillum sp.]